MTISERIIDTTSIDNGLKQIITSKDPEYDEKINIEAQTYAQHIYSLLPNKLHFSPDKRVFEQIKDGIVLGFVLDSIKPGCIDLRKLVQTRGINDKKYLYEATTNLGLVLKAASELGIKIVNIGPEDILYENKCLVLGLLWQIVRLSVSKSSNVMKNPELINLINETESIEDLCNKTPEEMCLRWVNYHMNIAKESKFCKMIQEKNKENEHQKNNEDNEVKDIHTTFKQCYTQSNDNLDVIVENSLNDDHWKMPTKCENFSSDIKNSRVYFLLFKQLIPQLVSDDELLEAWFSKDYAFRAENVVKIASRIGCEKFINVNSILKGDHRLNFLFCQTIMNKYPGIDNHALDIDVLKEKLCMYENNILSIKDNLEAITVEMIEKEHLRLQKEKLGEQLYQTIVTKSNEYENVIEDMKSSFDVFSRRVNEYVEESLGITLSDDYFDAKESLWATIMRLLSEIKVLKSERDSALISLASQKEINKSIDAKIKDIVEMQKLDKENREKMMKKKKRSIFSFCGCGES